MVAVVVAVVVIVETSQPCSSSASLSAMALLSVSRVALHWATAVVKLAVAGFQKMYPENRLILICAVSGEVIIGLLNESTVFLNRGRNAVL